MTIDRRTKLQEILDWGWPGWVAVGPAKGDLTDRCVLKNSSEGEVQLYLPQRWFDDERIDLIKAEIQKAARYARKVG